MSDTPNPEFTSAHDVIVARRTAHHYRSEPLPPGALERALLAANHAPCHKHTFPWRFTVIGPEARGFLANLSVEIKAAERSLSPEDAQRVRQKILAPPELVVASQLRHPDPFRTREDFAACACAIQNFSVSLAGDGVASKWSTGGITRHPGSYQALGIDPRTEEIVGFIWAGYAEQLPNVSRPPLDAVVRHTR
ncbi:MAG: nitroreductase family protein [Phycisphaerales bacterium]|nr:nitroreductase family protein [Phycisphaerales bacterium]